MENLDDLTTHRTVHLEDSARAHRKRSKRKTVLETLLGHNQVRPNRATGSWDRVPAGRGPANLDEVAQDLANLSRIRDDRDELHLGSTMRADQKIDLIYLCDQPRPCRTAGALGHGPRLGGCSVRGELLSMGISPANRGDTSDVRQVLPPSLASGGVKPVAVNVTNAPGQDELSEGGDKVRGTPERGVVLEVGIVGSVIGDSASGTVVGYLL